MADNESGAEGALHLALVARLTLGVTLGEVVSGGLIGKNPPLVHVGTPMQIVGSRTKQTRKQQIAVLFQCLVWSRDPGGIFALADQVRVLLAPDSPPDLSGYGNYRCFGALEPRYSYDSTEHDGQPAQVCDLIQEFWTVSI